MLHFLFFFKKFQGLDSPFISSIAVNKVGKVRRAKLYYLRERTGKRARIKEKRV